MPIIDPDKEVKVDDREPPDTLMFVKRLYPSAKKERLLVFDIQYKNVGFELKTWSDLINALTDKENNRFRNQLYNIFETLKNNPELDGYYFIFGDWSEINEYSDININAILGAIGSIQGRYGLCCNTFPDKEYAIYTACKTIEKTFDGKEPTPQTYRILTEERAKNVIYSSAERLSLTAVNSLCEIFETPKAIVNATTTQLMKANKVGKVIAERMYNTFNFDFKAKKEFEDEIDEELKIESNSDILLDKTKSKTNTLDIEVPNSDTLFDIEKDKIESKSNIEVPNISSSRSTTFGASRFDIEKDKIIEYEPEDEIIEAIEETDRDKEDEKKMQEFFGNAPNGETFDKCKALVIKAVGLYINKYRKSIPVDRLYAALKKYPEKTVKQALYDLELESKLYQERDGYWNKY